MGEYAAYLDMQRSYYTQPLDSKYIVGNYAWHEVFPYEQMLLNEYGEEEKPLFADLSSKSALDFGCGPGRMVNRMKKLFKRVDGVDLSQRLLDEAAKAHPDSKFFVSSGDDLGGAKGYDFIYSTICMQHIAVHSIRMNIFKHMAAALLPHGQITIQMACNLLPGFNGGGHALYREDKVNATGTNSACDVAIMQSDFSLIEEDMLNLFSVCRIWTFSVHDKYTNFKGTSHASYWPSHWLFINCKK